MAYRTGIVPGYPVRNHAVARDGAVRNTGWSMDGLGSEAVRAGTASHVGRGVDGMEAAAAKATAAMEATAMESASMKSAAVKTTAAMKTTATVKASTVSAAPVTSTTTSSLGNVRERQSQDCCQHCTRNNPKERQRDAFAVPSSQHVCLHRNRRQSGPGSAVATRKNALAGQ